MGFKSFLLCFDLYSRPPSLLINKKDSLTTFPGLFFSILTIIFFLSLFFSSDFVQNINPKVLYQSFFNESAPILQIHKNSFPIFFMMADHSGKVINDSSLFDLKVEFSIFKKDYSSEIVKFRKLEEKTIGIRKCEKDDFDILTIRPEELDYIFGKFNFTCLQYEDLAIKGDVEENEIAQIVTTFSPCQNGTSDVVCKSEEEIKKFFNGSNTVSLVYVNMNEDIEKFQNTIISKLKFVNFKIAYGQQIQRLMTLKKSFFKTISGILDERTLISLKLDELTEDFFVAESKPNAMLYLAMQVSRKYDKITRTYQTIGEALASVGSLVTIFGTFIRLIMSYFHGILYKLELLNNLYSFEMRDIEGNGLLQKNNLEASSTNSRKIFQKGPLNISIWRALIADLKMKNLFREKKSFEEKLYLKTENILRRDTNLPYILQKIHELEKIKLLLFDKTQLFTFNFLSKPTIFIPNYGEDLDCSKELSESLAFSDKVHNFAGKGLDIYEIELKEHLKKLENSDSKIDKKLLILLDDCYRNFSKQKNESLPDIPNERL